MKHLDFPFRFDARGRTADVERERHVRDLIEQVLFTAPGERVNRPTFGCGLLQQVFEPNSDTLAATTSFLVQSALQQWLGHLIQVDDVSVEAVDATFKVRVSYVVRRSQTRETAEFNAPGGAA